MPMIPGGLDPATLETMMGQGPPQAPPAPEMDPLAHLRQAIEHAQAALIAEPDDADSQALSKLVSGLYQILANRQKEQDTALGNPSLQSLLRR